MKCVCAQFLLLGGLVVSGLGSTVPQQIHVALAGSDAAGNPSTMAVSWQTEQATTTTEVQYGVQSGAYQTTASGYSGACK